MHHQKSINCTIKSEYSDFLANHQIKDFLESHHAVTDRYAWLCKISSNAGAKKLDGDGWHLLSIWYVKSSDSARKICKELCLNSDPQSNTCFFPRDFVIN